MNIGYRRLIYFIAVLVSIALSFGAGRWSSNLQQSVDEQARYPWQLHRKLSAAAISCDNFDRGPLVGRFYVVALDDGATLVAAALNQKKTLIFAVGANTEGQVAMESWPLDCARR